MTATTRTTSVGPAASTAFAAANVTYAMLLHRSEMKRKRMHVLKWSQSKIRLTDHLIVKQKQRIASCSNEDLQCMARGQDFRNFLYNQIVQRQMQLKVDAAKARNPSIVIAAPKPSIAPVVPNPPINVAAPINVVAPINVAAPINVPTPINVAAPIDVAAPITAAAAEPMEFVAPMPSTPAFAVFMHRSELKRKRMQFFKISQTKIYLTDQLIFELKQRNGNYSNEDHQCMLREMGFRNFLNRDLNRHRQAKAMQMKVPKLKRLQ